MTGSECPEKKEKAWGWEIPVLAVLILSTLFEGGDSPEGLMLVHSVVALMLIFLIGSFRRRNKNLTLPRSVLYLLPFAFFYLISVYFSSYKYSSLLCLVNLLIAFTFFLIVYNSGVEIRGLIKAVTLCAAVQSAVVLLDILFRFMTAGQGIFTNLSGTFLHPGLLSAYLLICAGLIAGLLVQREYSSGSKYLMFSAVILFPAVALLTRSRVALPGIALILISVMFVFLRKRKTSLVLISSVIIILSIFAVFKYKNMDPYRFHRLKIWKASVETFADNVLFGCGPGNFHYAVANHNFPNTANLVHYGMKIRGADSAYLELAAESGIGAILSLLFISGAVLTGMIKNKSLRWGLLPVLLYFMCAVFHPVFMSTALLFLVAALAAVLSRKKNGKSISLNISFPAACAMILILWTGAVLFPYLSHIYFKKLNRSLNAAEAIKNYNTAVLLMPGQPYVHSLFARMITKKPSISLQDFYFADKLMNKASDLNPLEPDFILDKARLYQKFIKTHSATPAMLEKINLFFSEAFGLNRKNAAVLYEWALFSGSAGDFERSRELLENALSVEPNFLKARLKLVELKLEKGDVAGASAEMETFRQSANAAMKTRPSSQYERIILTYSKEIRIALEEKLSIQEQLHSFPEVF